MAKLNAHGWTALEVLSDGEVLEVALNRADAQNAINALMVSELHEMCGALEQSPRILILTGGEDGVFAAGADITELAGRGRQDALEAINLSLFERIRALPLPTIAAIDGYALGGGAELAYACDVRVATPRAVFGQPEPRLGIIAAAGGCFRLPEIVGVALARDMLLTGRKLDAEEALAAGLVTRTAEPGSLLETARAVASEMLKSSKMALRLTKIAINAGPEAHPSIEQLAQAVLFEDDEKAARMSRFMDKGANDHPRGKE